MTTRDAAPGRAARAPSPGIWEFDQANTQVHFRVRHLGFGQIGGMIGPVSGTVVVAADPLLSSVSALVDVRRLHTGSAARDEHLRSEAFLDVANHPYVELRSTGLERVGTRSRLHGQLSVRGVPHAVAVDVIYEGMATHGGTDRAFLSAWARLDRTELGLTGGADHRAISAVAGRVLVVTLDVQLVRASGRANAPLVPGRM